MAWSSLSLCVWLTAAAGSLRTGLGSEPLLPPPPPAPTLSYEFNFPEDCGTRPTFGLSDNFRLLASADQEGVQVVRSTPVAPGTYPWQVQIEVAGKRGYHHSCEGVIISPELILTAGQCHTQHEENYQVRVGQHNRGAVDPFERILAVQNTYVHSGYRPDQTRGQRNDIALFKLKFRPTAPQGLMFNDYVQPICLPPVNRTVFVGQECHISGWGLVDANQPRTADSLSVVLRGAIVTILDPALCRTAYGNRFDERLMICAGRPEGGVDSCQGDGGGPLSCRDQTGQWFVAGIASFGWGCGEAGSPGVYTRVSAYLEWVHRTSAFLTGVPFSPPTPTPTPTPTLSYEFDFPEDCGTRPTFGLSDNFRLLAPANQEDVEVAGGSPVSPGTYPWQAQIEVADKRGFHHSCGGIVISPELILTAGHCRTRSERNYQVRVGQHDRQTVDPFEKILAVENTYVHSGYRPDQTRGQRNDIALFKLKFRPAGPQGLMFNDFVRPICLPPVNTTVFVGQECHISGWGLVDANQPRTADSLSLVLRGAIVTILDPALCRTAYRNKFDERLMICAGRPEGGVDSCQGDGGGPLSCRDQTGQWFAAGIASFGWRCGEAGNPGVYTRVSAYLEWVHRTSAFLTGFPFSPPTTPPTPTPTLPYEFDFPQDCGTRPTIGLSDNFRLLGPAHQEDVEVAGSSPVSPGTYPWQAQIEVAGKRGFHHSCGGIVISPELILTAGHCHTRNEVNYQVRVGQHDRQTADPFERILAVENTYVHSGYRPDQTRGQRNDIALFKLKFRPAAPQGLMFNDYVQPICLPQLNTTVFVGQECHISGWGLVDANQPRTADSLSVVLRGAIVTILDPALCRRAYRNKFDERLMICAGRPEGGVDSCQGDGGGPLSCRDQTGQWFAAGIASFGWGCGEAGNPGVYTRVSAYLEWVHRTSAFLTGVSF